VIAPVLNVHGPLLRFGTESKGKRRPLCQERKRGPGVFKGTRTGELCERFATQRSPEGLWVCVSHGDKTLSRRHWTPEEEKIFGLDARLSEIRAEEAKRREALDKTTRCGSCGCTALHPCVLRLDESGSVGLCARAGLEPWLTTCSGCLTPALRTAPEAWGALA
jgi:hypothetical protein